MIDFYIDAHSGVPPYLQLIQQVRRALKLGLLFEGDQLPTVKDVVGQLAINPNTVSKAYRELEHEGLVVARVGVGTFVATSLNNDTLSALAPLRHDLQKWMESARRAGLDDESIDALVRECFRSSSGTVVA
ncbi:MAG: GntR family transcriptional regulator [Acidimicrobiales bacterium]